MSLGKVSIVIPPKLPKELDDPEITKAFKALNDADSACSKKISAMLDEVTKVKKKINDFLPLIQKAFKEKSGDGKKAKAAGDYMAAFSDYSANFK